METCSTPADAFVGGPCECPARRRTSCNRRIKYSCCKGAQHENITKALSVFLASPGPSIMKTGLDPNRLVVFTVVAQNPQMSGGLGALSVNRNSPPRPLSPVSLD